MDPNSNKPAEGGEEQVDERPIEERAAEAFDEGVAEAEGLAPAPAKPEGDPDGDGEGAGEGGEGAGEGAGDGGDAGDGGEGEGDGKPAETDEERAEREKAERAAADKAEDDKAVRELGLRGKAEKRFRDLSGQVRELSQKLERIGGEEVIEQVAKLGGKDGLRRVLVDADAQRQWDEHMASVGCTPQQFGQAMGYLKAINSDDPAVLKQARDNLRKEVALLDERLGEKTELHDPLDQHPDLKAKVQRGEIDEADALELARLRGGSKRAEEQTAGQKAREAALRAQEEGRGHLAQLGAQLRQRDGDAVFKARMAVIGKALDAALPALPPNRWVEYAATLYESVTPPPAPVQQPRPRVGKSPARQSSSTVGSAGGAHRDKHENPWDAFDAGVEEAREVGL